MGCKRTIVWIKVYLDPLRVKLFHVSIQQGFTDVYSTDWFLLNWKHGGTEMINLKLTNSQGDQHIKFRLEVTFIRKLSDLENDIKAYQMDIAKIVTMQKNVSPPNCTDMSPSFLISQCAVAADWDQSRYSALWCTLPHTWKVYSALLSPWCKTRWFVGTTS